MDAEKAEANVMVVTTLLIIAVFITAGVFAIDKWGFGYVALLAIGGTVGGRLGRLMFGSVYPLVSSTSRHAEIAYVVVWGTLLFYSLLAGSKP